MNIILFFVIGAMMGSFVSYIGHRIFCENKKFFSARSVCPSCMQKISPFALIPIFSFLFLRGKCSKCKAKIPYRYLIIELSMALFFAAFYSKIGISSSLLLVLFIVFLCHIHIATDFEYYMASDTVTVLIGISSFCLAYVTQKSMLNALYYSLFGFGFFFIIGHVVSYILKKDSLGFGDVKLMGAISPMVTSFLELFIIIGLSGFIGCVLGLIWKKLNKVEYFPFAPPIILSFLINELIIKDYVYVLIG